MVWEEEDQCCGVRFCYVVVVSNGILLQIPSNWSRIAQTFILLYSLYLELNSSSRLVKSIHSYQQNTSQTSWLTYHLFCYHYHWILRIVNRVVTGNLVADLAYLSHISVFLPYHFCVAFEWTNKLPYVDPGLFFVDETEAENFEESFLGLANHRVAESFRQHDDSTQFLKHEVNFNFMIQRTYVIGIDQPLNLDFLSLDTILTMLSDHLRFQCQCLQSLHICYSVTADEDRILHVGKLSLGYV